MTNVVYKSFVEARLKGEKQNFNWVRVYERLKIMEKGLLGLRRFGDCARKL